MNRYDKGDVVRVTGSFTNSAGAAIDPQTVKFKYKHRYAPSPTVLTYGTDVQLVKDSTGNYHVDIDANDSGDWFYRWESTGTGQAAGEGKFTVKESEF